MNGFHCIYLCRLTRKAGEQLAQKMGQGLSQQQAWNKSSIDLVKASHVSMMSRVMFSSSKKVNKNCVKLFNIYNYYSNGDPDFFAAPVPPAKKLASEVLMFSFCDFLINK